MNHTPKQITNMAKRLELCVETTAQGDGCMRYEFFTPGDEPHTHGRSLQFCMGAREAYLFLRGYGEGRECDKGCKVRVHRCYGDPECTDRSHDDYWQDMGEETK